MFLIPRLIWSAIVWGNPGNYLSLICSSCPCIVQGMNTHEEIIKRIAGTFPPAGTIEDNLKSEDQIHRFDTECYQVTDKAILVWKDVWLPRKHIKIAWGEFKGDFVNVRLSVPKWLIIKTFLNEQLKID